MTPAEHYFEAERLAERAASWADFDRWEMTTEERISRATADAELAQAHAALAAAMPYRVVTGSPSPMEPPW